MNYYQRIKDAREDNDLKQSDIAKLLEIKQTNYSRYELGKNMMGIDKYIKLARYYNLSLDYLAGISDTPRPLDPTNCAKVNLLTEKQKKLLKAYEDNPELQKAVDKLLSIGE